MIAVWRLRLSLVNLDWQSVFSVSLFQSLYRLICFCRSQRQNAVLFKKWFKHLGKGKAATHIPFCYGNADRMRYWRAGYGKPMSYGERVGINLR